MAYTGLAGKDARLPVTPTLNQREEQMFDLLDKALAAKRESKYIGGKGTGRRF